MLSRESLVELVRGDQAGVLDRAIDTQVSRLRRKLNAHGGTELIRTIYGIGYALEIDVRPHPPRQAREHRDAEAGRLAAG